MPAKVQWETLRWVFAPVAVSSFEGAPWPLWLGCWTAKLAATLDTVIRIRQSKPKSNSTEVPPHSDDKHSWGQRRGDLRKWERGGLQAGCGKRRTCAGVVLIFSGLLDMIDDQNLDRALLRFEVQPQLLLQILLKRRSSLARVSVSRGWHDILGRPRAMKLRRPLEREIIISAEAGPIQHRPIQVPHLSQCGRK